MFFSSAWSGKRLPSKPFAQDGSTETTSKGKNCNGGTYHEGQGCFAVRCGEGWVWLVQLFSHQKRGRKKIDVFFGCFLVIPMKRDFFLIYSFHFSHCYWFLRHKMEEVFTPKVGEDYNP